MARFGLSDQAVYTRTVSHAPYQSPGYLFEVRWDRERGVVLDRWIDGVKEPTPTDLIVLQTMFHWLSHETWLWLVTPDGTLRFAPERQKHRSKMLMLRNNIVCHGDLAMAPGQDAVGVRRGPAVFGGEFNWTTMEMVGGVEAVEARDGREAVDGRDAMDARETVKEPEVYKDGGSGQPPPTVGVPQARAPTNKRTGWVMDNRSSYVANRATGVLKKSFLTVLLAPTEKV